MKTLSGGDYQSLFILLEDMDVEKPTPAYCKQIRTQFGLTMPVLMDDGTAMNALDLSVWNPPPQHWNMVFGEGAQMVYREKADDDAAMAAIEALLTAEPAE